MSSTTKKIEFLMTAMTLPTRRTIFSQDVEITIQPITLSRQEANILSDLFQDKGRISIEIEVPDPEEMTVEQICKELGREIVIKEK